MKTRRRSPLTALAHLSAVGAATGLVNVVRKRHPTLCEPKGPAPDCVDPVCSTKMDMFRKAMSSHQNASRSHQASSGKQGSLENAEGTGISEVVSHSFPASECPIDRAELGRGTWQLIHTLAAYLPESPTIQQQEAAKQFIISLSILYPCHICQPHFHAFVQKVPPR
jgi:hypothetical protein